jgi:hypothetical protein
MHLIAVMIFLAGCGAGAEQGPGPWDGSDVPEDICPECLPPDAGEIGDVDDMPFANADAVQELMDYCDAGCRTGGVTKVLIDDVSRCYYVTERTCRDHDDCEDGIFCNDVMRCGLFQDGTARCYYQCCPPCNDPCSLVPGEDPDCHPAVCIEEQMACLYPLKDSDRDGYADGTCEGGNDCDDGNAARHPGMQDLCNGEDDNCNGVVDEDGWAVPDTSEIQNPISNAGAGASLQTIVSLDGKWQAAWIENGSMIRFAVIETDGSVVSRDVCEPVLPEAAIGDISILGFGGSYYIVWSETNADGSQILIRALEGAGTAEVLYSTLATTGETVMNMRVRPGYADPSAAGIFFKMGVSTGGEDFEIFYLPVSDFTASPPELPSGNPGQVDYLGFSGYPDAAAVPDGWIVVWDDAMEGSREVYLTKLDFAGTVAINPPLKISSYPSDSQEPSIACLVDIDQCAVAWIDKRYGPFIVLGTLVDTNGTVISPEITVTSPPSSAWSHGVIADPGRGQFFVTYSTSSFPNQNHIYYNFLKMGIDTLLEPKLIEEEEGSNSTEPRGAMSSEGSLAILWKEVRRETAAGSIYLKLLSCP